MSESTLPPAQSQPSEPSSPKPKKKRRWPKILLGLVILLILLIVLLPTIISTGAVKSIVVSQVNKNLNGRVQIDSWSIGWTSGVRVDGVRVFDASNAQIVQLRSFSTALSLLGAARGNFDLGKTILDGLTFVAKFDKDGQVNFAKLLKSNAPTPPAATPPAAPANASGNPPADHVMQKPGPQIPAPVAQKSPSPPASKVPNVKGDIELTNISGSIEQEGLAKSLQITSLSGSVKIPDINQPIDDQLDLALQIGDSPAGSISVKGSAKAIANNLVALNTLNADQSLAIKGVDLTALAPFIPASVGITTQSGVLNGAYALKVTDGKLATLSGELDGGNLALSGPALKGDTYKPGTLKIVVPPINVSMPNGPSDIDAFAIKTGGDTVQPISITWDQGTVTASADAAMAALLNLGNNKAPGSNGSIAANVQIDVGKLLQQLPHAVPMQANATINSGQFRQTVQITLNSQNATFNFATLIDHVSGKNGAKPVQIQPISANITGQVGPGQKMPDVRNLELKLNSGFAQADFTAPTLAQLNGTAKASLQDATKEIGQFIDLKKINAKGDLNVSITNTADPENLAAKPAQSKAVVTLTGLEIDGLADQPVTQPWLQATFIANTTFNTDNSVKSIDGIQLVMQTNSPQNPTIDLLATAKVDLANGLSASYSLDKCNVILADLQKQVGPLVPALRGAPPLELGTLSAASKGELTQSATGLMAKVHSLAISESKGLFSVEQAPGDIAMSLPHAGAPQASGTVKINADLVRLSQLVQTATSGKAALTVNGKQQTLASGKLAGTVSLASADASSFSVAVDMAANDLSANLASGPSQRVSITFGLKASPVSDFTAIKNTSLYVKSDFANVNIDNVAVNLPAGGLPLLKSADVNVNVTDLGPLNTIAQTFMPAPTDANAPRSIQIPQGSLKVTANASQNGQTLTFKLAELSGTDIRLQKGSSLANVKPFKLNAVAAIDFSQDMKQIAKVTVSQLAGSLGVADLSMPESIVINDPMGSMAASGAIQVAGKLEDVTTLLETLDGKKAGEEYPYSGAYTLAEAISTQGTTITPKGTINVTDFKVMQNGTAVVNDPKISIANDVGLDLTHSNVQINNVSIDMPSSGAIKLVVTGAVNDYLAKRQFDNLAVNLTGDWAKLWPIIKPLVPPADQEQVKDLQIAGQFQKQFHVSGSLPAGMDFAEAIKLLSADGSIAVAKLSSQSQGIDVSNVEVPFTLKNGIVKTVYADKPADQNTPAPMTVNGGTVSIGNLAIDLTDPNPRLTAPANLQLAKGIGLNAVLAAKMGKYIPLFSNSSSATGLVDATINSCDRLPLSAILTQNVKENDGTLKITYSVQKLQIDSPVVDALLAVMSKSEFGNSLQGSINNATASIAKGEVQQQTTLSLGEQQGRSIGFTGGVNMESLKLDNFIINMSPLLLSQVDKGLAKYLPAGIDIGLKGTATSPKLDLGSSIKTMVGNATKKAALDALTGGNKKTGNNPASSQPAKTPADDIGDILKGLGKKKKK